MVKKVMPKKDWYKSKTIQAGAFTLLVIVLGAMYGETTPIVTGLVAIGTTFGLYGRFVSTTELK